MKHITFYLDFISPYAYLAFEEMPRALMGQSYSVTYKPILFAALLKQEAVYIYGDGETSRDFCFVGNAVQANLLAATATDEAARNQVYNVAVSGRTTLNTLFDELKSALGTNGLIYDKAPVYREFRAGDVRHSQADIAKVQRLLGYAPQFDIESGVAEAMIWYKNFKG